MQKKTSIATLVCQALIFMLLIAGFQNCGGLEAIKSNSLASDGVSGPGGSGANSDGSGGDGNDGNGVGSEGNLKSSLQPNLVSDCLTNDAYNACIFWKNPVAQNGAPLAQPVVASSDLSTYQLHAVNIDGFNNSGTLQNNYIRVQAITDNNQLSVVETNGDYKFSYNDPTHRLGQVMAFYWLNLQGQYMDEVTGAFYVLDKGVDVYAYDPGTVNNAYWNPNAEQVVMGSTPDGNQFSLSAEVYTHEMGHANLSFASNFAIHQELGAEKNIVCGNGNVCCTTVSGCSWAINEGQADYHSGILFPESSTFLETLVNNPNGIDECGVPRTLTDNQNLTAQQAYDACDGFGLPGEVHVTGRIYASVWWEVRLAAEAQNPGTGADEVDQLFTDHLVSLNGDDDFITAMDKIIATDNALFGGKYSSFFVDEFGRRGIEQ